MSDLQKPIGLLVVAHDAGLYGATRSLTTFLTRCDRSCWAPLVVASAEGDLTARLADVAIETIVVPGLRWVVASHQRKPAVTAPVLASFEVARVISRRKIDLVYTNTVTCVAGALGARLAGRPHVWHLREHGQGNTDLKPVLPWSLVKPLVRVLSTRIVCNSNDLVRSYARPAGRSKFAVVYNGVDCPTDAGPEGRRSQHDCAALHLPSNVPVVSLIGSITPRKRVDLFLQAAALIQAEIPATHFVIVGDGPSAHSQEVRAIAAGLGLQNLHWTGWMPDVAPVLRRTDVLISCSDQEAFGRAIVEAMSWRVPVVATRSGGPQEIVVDGVTGFLVDTGDRQGLALEVVRLLRSPPTRSEMGHQARRRVEECFGADAYVRALERELLTAITMSQP